MDGKIELMQPEKTETAIVRRREGIKMTLLIFGAALLLVMINIVYKSSFIEISASGNKNGTPLTDKLQSQGDSKPIKLKTDETTLRQRVPRGNYEVWVDQAGVNYFAVIKAQGF